jgi:hypothetical protein
MEFAKRVRRRMRLRRVTTDVTEEFVIAVAVQARRQRYGLALPLALASESMVSRIVESVKLVIGSFRQLNRGRTIGRR